MFNFLFSFLLFKKNKINLKPLWCSKNNTYPQIADWATSFRYEGKLRISKQAVLDKINNKNFNKALKAVPV